MDESSIPTDSSGTPLPASLVGYFLISETELVDPNFIKTVVLIVSHNEEGAFGLVVNRPTDFTLSDVVDDFEQTDIGDSPTFIGGPVEQQYLFTLHSGLPSDFVSEFATSPLEGVHFEPVFQSLEQYLSRNWDATTPEDRPNISFYLGYAGWGPDQLEGELREGAWLVMPADPAIVFHPDPADAWYTALSRKGGLYHIVAQTGFKPSMN